MNRTIEQLEAPSVKRTVQISRAPSRTQSLWYTEKVQKQRRVELSDSGQAAPAQAVNIKDLVLQLHDRRMAHFEKQLAAGIPGVEEERNNYLLECGPILGKFGATDDHAERKLLTIEYLVKIGDQESAVRVEEQWTDSAPPPQKQQVESATAVEEEEAEAWLRSIVAKAANVRPESNKGGTKKTAVKREEDNCCKVCGETEVVEDRATYDIACLSCGTVRGGRAVQGQSSSSGSTRPAYTYNRSSHFKDRILQWLGSEYHGDIDRSVLDKLLLQMRIEKIASVENWTKKRMVSLLKRAGLNEYYEHSHHFISVLSGKPVPFRISQETFDTLLQMFEKFEQAYERHKHLLTDSRHSTRKNIVTVSYVLRKFFMILGMPAEAESFPLLKNLEKVRHYEIVFKKCCEDLGWPWYPSL